MTYTLPAPEDENEEVIVRQQTTIATITTNKLNRVVVDYEANRLEVVDSRRDATDRIVLVNPYVLRLLDQQELIDPIVAGDVGNAFLRVLNKRVYDILIRLGHVTPGGSVS